MAIPVDFAGVYQPSVHLVYSYFSRRLGSGAQAMDATETVFRAAFADWFRDGPATVDARLLLSHCHLLWTEGLGIEDLGAGDTGPRDTGAGAESVAGPSFPGGTDRDRRWHSLTLDERELLMLANWDELSAPEIAELLQISTRRAERRLHAATAALDTALQLDPVGMSNLDPLRDKPCDDALSLRMLRRISDEGVLISDNYSDSANAGFGEGACDSANAGVGNRRGANGRRIRAGTHGRHSYRPLAAGLILVAVSAAVLLAGVGFNQPPPVAVPPEQTAGVSGDHPPSFTQPTTSRTYGPFSHWSRFEALNTSVSFELPPMWSVNSVSTTRGTQSTLYAQVLNRGGEIKGVLSLGSRADVPYTCSLNPKAQGHSTTLESIPISGLTPFRPGNVPSFRYQVLDGSPFRSTLGIGDDSFAVHSAGCTEPDIVQQQGAGGPLYVSFGGQENLPYPGREGSGGGMRTSLVFDTMAEAQAYRATTEYANTKRMMTSLRIKSRPVPARAIVMDPSTGQPACEISNVRGPNNDTTYEDHPDYFEVLGCAGKWLAFRATYQSAPARPKLIYFARRDGLGYSYNPDLPSAQVLGWVELTDPAAATGQTPSVLMDHNFAAAGIPVALREKLVGNGP